MDQLDIHLVIDAGANVGQYGADIRDDGYEGRILSFEPLNSAFQELQKRTALDRKWQCVQTALGDEQGKSEIYVSGNSPSSSLLPMQERHVRALPVSQIIGRESVRVSRLDAFRGDAIANERIWFKLDVQGYEHKVLAGAAGILPQVRAIEMEMCLVTLYEGQELIDDSLKRVASLGFCLSALEEVFFDERTLQVLAVNGIFLREGAKNA
jgi:FkbM family methyltransferase